MGLFNRLTSGGSRINFKGLLFVALLARWQHESERFCDRPSRYRVSWHASVWLQSQLEMMFKCYSFTNASHSPDLSSSK